MLVNYGYTVKTNDLKVDYNTARRIMSSKNKLKFSRVDCEGEHFVFRTETIECPVCHAKYDARKILPSEPTEHTSYEVERFFDPQLDFNYYNAKRSMQINEATFKDKSSVTCPFCHNIIYKTNTKRKVILDRNSEKVTVKLELKNFKELLACLFAVADNMTIEIGNSIMLSCWEALIFDKDGNTYLSFEDEFNTEVYRKDITESFDADEMDICLSIINNNENIKEYIIDFFRPFWDGRFPFDSKNLGISDFIALNRFKGFNRTYYSAIPYELGTLKIEDSFNVYTNRNDAIAAFENTTLPKSKIIRKTVFNNQGLLLYLPELESLYSNLGNISIFNEIIGADHIQILLYYLHTYPSINQFIKDYCNSNVQARKFANLLKRSVGLTCELAKDYAIMSAFYKQKASANNFSSYTARIERASEDYRYLPKISIKCPYSMPMAIPDGSLDLEDTVFGFDFRFLRTTNETRHAGKVLSNCLQDWTCTDDNVLVIKRYATIVAAIQLSRRHTRVEQVRLANNDNIEDDEKIYKAFTTWYTKHNLLYCDCNWDYDYD